MNCFKAGLLCHRRRRHALQAWLSWPFWRESKTNSQLLTRCRSPESSELNARSLTQEDAVESFVEPAQAIIEAFWALTELSIELVVFLIESIPKEGDPVGVVVVGGRCEVVGESPCHFFLISQQLFAAKDIKGDRRKLAFLDLRGQDQAPDDQALKFADLHPASHREEKIDVVAGQHAGLAQDQLLARLAHQKASQSLTRGRITARMF